MAGDVVAAGLDGLPAIIDRGADFAGDITIYQLVWRMANANGRAKKTVVASRRLEPRGLHRRVQLGDATDSGVARRALSRRVAGLGVGVGRKTAPDMGERAALRRGVAGGFWNCHFILAGASKCKIEFARRFFGIGFQHFVGDLQPADAISRRGFGWHRKRRAHDVDGGHLAVAVGLARLD